MNKKSVALIAIGVAIGWFGAVASWWIITEIPNEDIDHCRALGDTILSYYDKIFDEDGERDERAIQIVMRFSDSWYADNCYVVFPELASTMRKIQNHVLELEASP